MNAPILIIYSVYISLDTMSLASTLILNALNQRWQLISHYSSSHYNLSKRYQVSAHSASSTRHTIEFKNGSDQTISTNQQFLKFLNLSISVE